ncbi:MAG: ankyrin repeat domain-containing protein [Planctomycetota bacterium]|jgi:type II secretion system protein G
MKARKMTIWTAIVLIVVTAGNAAGASEKVNKAFIAASQRGDLSQVKLLLEHGADVDAVDKDGKTALMYASESGSDIVTYLLKHGADVDAADKDGKTALMYASVSGCDWDIVAYLLTHGADVDTVDKNGKTALMYASQVEYFDAVWPLEEAEAVERIGESGYRESNHSKILIYVATRGRLDLVKECVKKGADVNFSEKGEFTGLRLAASRGYLDVVKYLVENAANVEVSTNSGFTALMHASLRGHLDVVKYLVENGADVEASTNAGSKALIHASVAGHLNVVEYLVENGADVGVSNNSGLTPLIAASTNRYLDVVKFLVENGANVHAVDKDGKTALDRAIGNDSNIAEYLRAAKTAQKLSPSVLFPTSASTFTYFTQDKNISNLNTQLPARKGLLKKDENGISSLGNYLEVAKAPRSHLEITIDMKLEDNMIVFSYHIYPQSKQINDRIPIYQQVFREDPANTHVYLIFPEEFTLSKEIQIIDTISNGTGRGARLAACSPENTKLSRILRKYNAAMEGTYELTKSDKSEMERALDNTTDVLGKVGLGIRVTKDVIKFALQEDEKKRIERLQEKYRDCQIHKMPFHGPEGISLAYTYIGRSSTIYFDVSSAAKPGKVFIEIPRMTFGLTAFGATRKASLEGLVYELGLTSQARQEKRPPPEATRETRWKIAIIENVIGRFYWDCGRYPYDSEGLKVLIERPGDIEEDKWSGPYLKQSDLLDQWGNPVIYRAEGKINAGSFDLISLGKDGVDGGQGINAEIYNK